VRAWAEFLVKERAAQGKPYVSPFDSQLQLNGQKIASSWSVDLRYHKNLASAHEMRTVRRAVGWLLANVESL
jgi:hypothetical protein